MIIEPLEYVVGTTDITNVTSVTNVTNVTNTVENTDTNDTTNMTETNTTNTDNTNSNTTDTNTNNTDDTSSNTTDTNTNVTDNSSSIEFNEVYEFRKTNVFNNISYDDTTYYPNNFGFMFAIQYISNSEYDPSKMYFQVAHADFDPNSGENYQQIPLSY